MTETMTIQIGGGIGSSYEGSFGQMGIGMENFKKTTTLGQIARQLAKQLKIKDGVNYISNRI